MSVDPSRLVERLARSRRIVRSQPGGTIRLDNGDPDFNTPEPIRRAHAEALEAGRVHYVHPQGDPELRDALAESVSEAASTQYDRDQVVVTHGATGALSAAILATVDPGDGVLMPEPTYSLYSDLVAMAGGQPIFVPTRAPEFRLDAERLDAAAAKAGVLVLCSPCNPTGVVYRQDELDAIAEIANRRGLVVIADEAYDHIVYPPARFVSFLSLDAIRERLIYVQTFSKTYAMTGWRIGFLAAQPTLAAACARVHRTVNGPANAAVQAAALAALAIGDEWSAQMLAEYTARRSIVVEGLASRGLSIKPPDGTFYAFVPHARGLSSERMTDVALEHLVAVRPGSEYGPSGEGFLRLAFSASRQELSTGIERLAGALASVTLGVAKIGADR